MVSRHFKSISILISIFLLFACLCPLTGCSGGSGGGSGGGSDSTGTVPLGGSSGAEIQRGTCR